MEFLISILRVGLLVDLPFIGSIVISKIYINQKNKQNGYNMKGSDLLYYYHTIYMFCLVELVMFFFFHLTYFEFLLVAHVMYLNYGDLSNWVGWNFKDVMGSALWSLGVI